MIILSIDYGTRHVGLAISDEREIVAMRLPSLTIKRPNDLIEGLKALRKNIVFEKILLGLPDKGENRGKIQEIAKTIQKELDIPVEFWNEDFSSKSAEKGTSKKFKKEKAHSEAARIFLQEYLEDRSSES
ncbi:Holliday junction resolvase RuvX [Candidatus Dojkabacteria bacterium]|nr:Holliday junction resolvase RuvX [Candidatus Dojkabacteria bacterium]